MVWKPSLFFVWWERWNSPYINHFTSPDSIIPEQSQGVQAWDRYAYASNNPVRHNDPSGHCIEDLCVGELILLAIVAEEVAPEVEAFIADEGPLLADETTVLVVDAQPIVEQAVAGGEQLAQEAVAQGGQVVQQAGAVIQQTENQLLRYIHPNNILSDGRLSSLAFKDAAMSVYDESLGATPEMVLDVMSKGTGQGAVYSLDPNVVQNIPGVTSIEPELGTTGNSVLDAAHQVINNVGTKAVARTIRDVAQYILGDK